MERKKILVVGATGFVGAYATARLLLADLPVVGAVRDVAAAKLKFQKVSFFKLDFNAAFSQEEWLPRLQEVDVIVNIAGLLDATRCNRIEKVHVDGPRQLVECALKAGVRRFIHVSALGIENEDTTAYALTKKQFDAYLMAQTQIDWVILRPSLIYGAGCFGGTSLMRGLASLPCVVPLVGKGDQVFQPIHVDDLTQMIVFCVNYQQPINQLFEVVGPQALTMKEILTQFRAWLGLKKAIFLPIPAGLIELASIVGDWIGGGPLTSTSYKMLHQSIQGDASPIIALTHVKPRSLQKGLNTTPLTIQSLWHARLFLIKPFIKLGLALFWIISGLLPLLFHRYQSDGMLGVSKQDFYIGCILDIILGLMLFSKCTTKLAYILQLGLMCFYMSLLSVTQPMMWLDPVGALTKNIPLLLLTVMMLSIEKSK